MVLKFIGGGIVFGASLLGVVLGVALLTNRLGLADRLLRHEEGRVVEWGGSIASRQTYFKRVVRLDAVGLIAWGAFFPSVVIPAAHALAAVSLFSLFVTALAMAWQSERAMGALGLPILSPGRLRSAPWQVRATFYAALSVGVLVDFLVTLALKSG